MDTKSDLPAETPIEHLRTAVEVIAENRSVFERLAESELPVAEDAECALDLLEKSEVEA